MAVIEGLPENEHSPAKANHDPKAKIKMKNRFLEVENSEGETADRFPFTVFNYGYMSSEAV